MRRLNFCLAVIYCVSSIANDAWGEPKPLDVSGDLSDGNQIQISGLDFGEKPNAAPLFFDTQDEVWISGDVVYPYDGVPDGTGPLAVDSPVWAGGRGDVQIWREGGYPRYRSDFANSGRTAFLNRPASWPDENTKEVKEVYIRWWWKATFDPGDKSFSADGSGTSAKFIRIWDSAGSTEHAIRVSWTQMHMTGMGGSMWANWNGPGDVGVWNLFEVYLNSQTGNFRAWINNELLHSVSGYDFGDPYGIVPRQWGIDASGERDWGGEVLEFSDYYADSTRARVEIGDAPNWADVRIREPQVPIAWSSSAISVVLHQGFLGDFDGMYLYVIDSNGQVNEQGYPLGVPRPNAPASLWVE